MKQFNRITVILLMVFPFHLSFSQMIKGKTIDKNTKEPVPYVGIGVINREIGTVSDVNGNFTIDITNAVAKDTLRFSSISYSVKDTTVEKLRQNPTSNIIIFELAPTTFSLNEVSIRTDSSKTETEVIGNTVHSGVLFYGFSSSMLGTELGTVLKYRENSPGRIKSVNFNLGGNIYDSVLFEVNIYTYIDGAIGASILKKPIYLEPRIKSGTLTLNLQDSSIYIQGDVLLSLELIRISKKQDLDQPGYRRLMFHSSILNSPSYTRKTAQDPWEKVAGGGVGFWAIVSYIK